jgi:hypothetical protein
MKFTVTGSDITGTIPTEMGRMQEMQSLQLVSVCCEVHAVLLVVWIEALATQSRVTSLPASCALLS